MQKKILSMLVLQLLIAASVVGCSGLRFHREELALLDTAKRAYKCEARAPSVNKYSRHFERGWKQAYYNVAKGLGTCPPSTPPEAYWSHKYKNPDGCRKIAAWYEGYRLGSEAAQRDCQHLFSDVPIVGMCEREDVCECCPEEVIRSEEVSSHAELSDASSIESSERVEVGVADMVAPIETSVKVASPSHTIQLSSLENEAERLPNIESE